MKKLLSSIIPLLLTVLALGTSTASADTDGALTYSISDGEATVIRCSSLIYGRINVPATLGGCPVTAVSSSAFSNCSTLFGVTLPDTVKSIGTDVFKNSTKLDYVKLPKGITSVTKNMFYGCDSLVTVVIPNGIKSIDDYAFYSCDALSEITLPDSITAIGKYAFNYCKSLSSVKWPSSLTTIGEYAFNGCNGLTEISFPDSVKTIDRYAFYNSKNLVSVNFSDSLESIGEYAFEFCDNLTDVDLSGGVKSIGKSSFWNCKGLISVTLPHNVSSIGEGAFGYCPKLESIDVDENNMYYSSLDGSLYNKDKTQIIQYATGKPDTSFKIPYGVTAIGNNAFYNSTYLTTVKIPYSVTNIGEGAFQSSYALASVTIPDSVTTLGKLAFSSCKGLTEVVIPKSITSISNQTFYSCNALKTVYYTGSEEEWKNITIAGLNDPLKSAQKVYNYNPSRVATEITGASSNEDSLKLISQVEIEGRPEIASFGTAFIPLWLFETGSGDNAVVEYDNSQYNISDGQSFGATLTDVPSEAKDMAIVGKSFVKDANGNYTWSAAKAASVNNTALTIN